MRQAAFDALYRPEEAFVSGLTPESRESSRTGAEAAEHVRSRNLEVLSRLWATPRTMQEVAAISGLALASVCSLKAALGELIVWDSYEHIEGTATRKATKRSRWKLK